MVSIMDCFFDRFKVGSTFNLFSSGPVFLRCYGDRKKVSQIKKQKQQQINNNFPIGLKKNV